MHTPMTDEEVRTRLGRIKKYNAYFKAELDSEGQPLTQHIVGHREIWRIMTKEWKVDPKKFGITEPPPFKKDVTTATPPPVPAALALDAPSMEGVTDDI